MLTVLVSQGLGCPMQIPPVTDLLRDASKPVVLFHQES